MGRGVQIAAAILAVIAVACVLITPDLTDDVYGVVHSSHLDLTVAADALPAALGTAVPVSIVVRALSLPHALADFAAVTCVRLC